MNKTYPTKKLGEVCKTFTDGDWIETKDQSSSGIRLIQTGNIGNGVFLNKAGKSRYISEQTFKRLNCTEIFPGDILISRLPDPVGRSCIIPDAGKRMITAVDCTIVRTNKNQLLPKFLLFYTNSSDYYSQIREHLSGTTRQRISRGNLAKLEIPLPPLLEQKKIVAKLERVLAKISEAKKLRAEARKNADNLLPAELHKIFSQQGSYSLIRANKRIVKKWEEKELGEICEKTSNMKWDEHKSESFQYIDLTSVSREVFSITETKEVNSKNAPSRAKKIVRTDDVIFGTTRPTLMRVTIIPQEYNNQVCSTGFTVLRASRDHILPQFIYYFIRSERFMDRMENIQTGASYPAVSDAKVFDTKIPLPPLAEQKRIVKHLDSLSQKLQKLQAYQKSTQSDFLTLEQSVLSKAFTNK